MAKDGYEMYTILVTGGAGFIGSNFIRYVLEKEKDVRVVNVDALTYAGNKESLENLPDPKRHVFIQGGIEDMDFVTRLLREYKITKIIHFAAETHVDRSIVDPELFMRTNVTGTYRLLMATLKYWEENNILDDGIVRFHHISTDEVFGALNKNDSPFDENTPYQPNSPYSASKAASDHFVRSFQKTYGLPITITNCSNNYGPYQYPEKLIPLIVLNAVEGKPLPVYGKGAQIRDWLYVVDHCDAIWKVLCNGVPGETYCIGGDTQVENIEVVKMLCKILDEEKPLQAGSYEKYIQFVTDRPGHDFRYAINCNKIKQQLGWQPKTTLHDGLRATIRWYLNNEAWVTAIRNKPSYQEWIMKNYLKRG